MTTEHLRSQPKLPPEIKKVIQTWTRYSEQTEILVHLTHEGLAHIQRMPKVTEILRSVTQETFEEKPQKQRQWKADRAREEADGGFPILHAHSLLGLWGAFECLIEDLFIASLESCPELLSNETFSKVKIPAPTLTMTDPQECFRTVLREASRLTNSDLSQGTTKFERLLRLVNLDGSVPRIIADSVFSAQQVRNIWAHRGGIADTRFIERYPASGATVGVRFDIGPEAFNGYMHGLHMYGVVILNRVLRAWGLEEVTAECSGYEGSLTSEVKGS